MPFVQIECSQDAVDILVDYLDRLHGKAVDIVQAHYAVIRTQDQKRDWDKRSVLFPRVNRQKGALAFALEWYEVKWIGHKAQGGRKQLRRYIAKGKSGHIYPMGKLLKVARDWEIDLVQEMENQLSKIRLESYQLQRALFALRASAKALEIDD